MMSRLSPYLTRFRREEDGNATVEFAFYFTVFFLILAAGIEIAILNLRHTMLERGVDLATREIRLSTGHVPAYSEVKAVICAQSVMGDCEANLRLEMRQVDPRNFDVLPHDADCQNAEETPRPVRTFEAGQDNELMLIRACLKFKPILPTTALGKALTKDDDGYSQLIVNSAFVQEPR
ncbi:TadE/TadG family type IV pilus assembly protein [Ponticoccus sp. (in: a-proteobacteria)]|uniref:TadE/TadG family type IV pilus assembly protein n=1 Tax=Ponticoccus sp. (in: a-proteobacteria) TaxID=1925025 RepID=UPI003AB1F0C2